MYRIGVDVGGTFTDFTILNQHSGDIFFYKVSSTPHDPSEAIRTGLRELLAEFSITPEQVAFVGHGTTVVTNLVIERKGIRTALLTTKGFRDVLEIGRQTRPNLYDYRVGKPAPLVERAFRFEIDERISADGEVVRPIAFADVTSALGTIRASGIQAVAICFLHSYLNPEHERAVRDYLLAEQPDLYVTASSDLLPEFREYERLSTTVLNSYAGPRIRTYLDRLADGVADLGIGVKPYTIHSNGGLMSIATVRQFPVRTCLSGPAAGVVGGAVVAKRAGFENVITFDVGGTSTDVSLISRGQPQFTSSRTVADYPVKTPMVDIHVIGAGGGSIAWIDDAGALKVGPHSAGAVPGPVAYGLGGTEPTVTDANIVLHRLNPEALLRGKLPVHEAMARDAIETKIARPLGLSVEEAAVGILRIANANMGRAIRSVSTERGFDLSTFAIMAFGGAGPLHANDLALECGLPTVIVPREPGTMCARGILLSDISLDFVRTRIDPVSEKSLQAARSYFDEMRQEGNAWLDGEKVPPEMRRFQELIECRYLGQNFEVAVEVQSGEEISLDSFREKFAAAHRQEYGYDIPGRAIEVVNCRTKAIGLIPRPLDDYQNLENEGAEGMIIAHRDAYFSGTGRIATPVYERVKLPVNAVFQGPAIIEEMSSTTVVLPDSGFHVDSFGNIIISAIGSKK